MQAVLAEIMHVLNIALVKSGLVAVISIYWPNSIEHESWLVKCFDSMTWSPSLVRQFVASKSTSVNRCFPDAASQGVDASLASEYVQEALQSELPSQQGKTGGKHSI